MEQYEGIGRGSVKQFFEFRQAVGIGRMRGQGLKYNIWQESALYFNDLLCRTVVTLQMQSSVVTTTEPLSLRTPLALQQCFLQSWLGVELRNIYIGFICSGIWNRSGCSCDPKQSAGFAAVLKIRFASFASTCIISFPWRLEQVFSVMLPSSTCQTHFQSPTFDLVLIPTHFQHWC